MPGTFMPKVRPAPRNPGPRGPRGDADPGRAAHLAPTV